MEDFAHVSLVHMSNRSCASYRYRMFTSSMQRQQRVMQQADAAHLGGDLRVVVPQNGEKRVPEQRIILLQQEGALVRGV